MEELREFFAPGRVELGGNHTDHQGGCVLGAACRPGIKAYAVLNGTDTINIESEGFGAFSVDLGDTEPKDEEKGLPVSLLRGICDCFIQSGNVPSGFDAEIHSGIKAGSGLSSSAAFEILIGKIISGLCFCGGVPPLHLALFGKRAENEFFGKPCGLLDQLVCALGGTVFADFAEPEKPVYRNIDYDFSKSGYVMLLAESGASHENLTADYAKISGEMRLGAMAMGINLLSEADEAQFYAFVPQLRERFGERVVLRCAHYYDETRRATEEAEALERGDFPAFLELFRASAESSEKYLQNIVSEGEPEQLLRKCIEVARELLCGEGAVRVHGGGFAGTAQIFVPQEAAENFAAKMEAAGFTCFAPEIL